MTQTADVIGFDYTLKDKDGEVIDSSEGKVPLFVLMGHGQIIPGLESAIKDMKAGDTKQVIVLADEGYGPVRDDLKLSVARSQFPPDAELKPGVQFQVNNDPSAPIFTITSLDGESVHIDGNHPLAGVDLYFDVTITDKRPATDEEMAHGHAHGPGGHHHG